MSNLLWKYYLEDDVERFRKLLVNGHNTPQHSTKGRGGIASQSGSLGAIVGSPATAFSTSPRTTKSRKSSAHIHGGAGVGARSHTNSLGRTEVNGRDHAGMTILHRAVSSTGSNAIAFALALIENPSVDLYIQDLENGWTALHRALYFGNITIARAIMERDSKDSIGQGPSTPINRINALIKIKDREGNSAFDVYNATISRRILPRRSQSPPVDGGDDDDDDSIQPETGGYDILLDTSVDADELYAFGSNKNLTLGFGDEDDRQYPEKINLKRPEHLLFRFHRENLLSRSEAGGFSVESAKSAACSVSDLPALIKNRPILIQDVALSKLHSAILTTDPESNLYICGFGPGGRLGTGDDTTRFTYVSIEGGVLAGKKITAVALGQNHTMAVSSDGEIFTWGTNTWGQLGYSLPQPGLQNKEPVNSSPRQIFGPLKREHVRGIAASAIHSVAFTLDSLFTWGKNDGQLGLMDSDSRSLEVQTIPRRVAASLFNSSIQMVSAINRATICLLANHSVYVFTNYGYNNVKFPLHDGFSNLHLKHTPFPPSYESRPNHVSSITSGGDTIAAISSRGDLFTLNVNEKIDTSHNATSTTNPSKIRNALSQPQCIWYLRKGHWDGIKSVGVAENGSVIICTESGAVWRRIRRPKIKDTYASGSSASKSKDYKFQRVPGLTNVAAVRSSVFGTYAALRKDCDITRNQISVNKQGLWEDLAPLFLIRDLQASKPSLELKPKYWVPRFPNAYFCPFRKAVLASPDLEADTLHYVHERSLDNTECNINVHTDLSEVGIPVHGFMLAARSPLLMEALSSYRKLGTYNQAGFLTLTGTNNPKVIFHAVDFLTIVNLVLYVYSDAVADVWLFTPHIPKSASRFRQSRVELIRLASRLGMSKLEAAARSMLQPEPCLDKDLNAVFDENKFLEDGDVIVELGNVERVAHSSLLRRRCLFFEGLFNGRAGGSWLAGRRRTESERIRIDMNHIDPSTFELVLRYLYADVGTELFDDIVSSDIDELCDIVLDVASAANELMLDRLSQICQQVIGRFVNTRNVCQLLNTVAPCSVSEFKDAGLEYLCLQLETMLENHLLNELDEDLMLELDEVVRANQVTCLPFVKSGKAELLLHQRYPTLARELDEERQRRIRDMAFRASIKDDDSRLSSSYRTFDDMTSPSQDKLSRKSKASRNAPFSPAIRPKDSLADLMFDMDDEDMAVSEKPTLLKQRPIDLAMDLTSESPTVASSKEAWQGTTARMNPRIEKSPLESPPSPSIAPTKFSVAATAEVSSKDDSSTTTGMPWPSAALPSSRLDMREIMAQASRDRTSTLSKSLSAERAKADTAKTVASSKLSQKERKRQQQALQQAVFQPQSSLEKPPSTVESISPWQLPITGPKVSLKDVLDIGATKTPPTTSLKPTNGPMPALSQDRQRTASPDTRFAGQHRTINSSSLSKEGQASGPNASTRQLSQLSPALANMHTAPFSRSYTSPIPQAEPSLQLSMADIIGQQKREQDLVKEAVAKRSLQEIQEEQAFQEWWDQESRRTQEEEAARASIVVGSIGGGGSGSRGKSGKRGRRGGHKWRGDMTQQRGQGRGRGRGSGLTQGQGAPAG